MNLVVARAPIREMRPTSGSIVLMCVHVMSLATRRAHPMKPILLLVLSISSLALSAAQRGHPQTRGGDWGTRTNRLVAARDQRPADSATNTRRNPPPKCVSRVKLVEPRGVKSREGATRFVPNQHDPTRANSSNSPALAGVFARLIRPLGPLGRGVLVAVQAPLS